MSKRIRIPEAEFATDWVIETSARRYFARAVNKVTPEVYEALVSNVVPVAISEDPICLGPSPELLADGGCLLTFPSHVDPNPFARFSDKLTATIETWASTYHLDIDWLLSATKAALVGGVIGRDSADLFTPEFWEKSCGPDCFAKRFDPPVLKVRWDPQMPDWYPNFDYDGGEDQNEVLVSGTRKHAETVIGEAVKDYLNTVEESALAAGLQKSKEKRSDKGDILDHFEWLALKLVRQENWYQLMKFSGKTIATVKDGVRSACKLTNIPLEAVDLTPR